MIEPKFPEEWVFAQVIKTDLDVRKKNKIDGGAFTVAFRIKYDASTIDMIYESFYREIMKSTTLSLPFHFTDIRCILMKDTIGKLDWDYLIARVFEEYKEDDFRAMPDVPNIDI